MYLVVAHSDRFVRFVSARTERLPHSMRNRVGRVAAQAAAGFGALRDGRPFYRILVTSIMQWALMGRCVFIALRALAASIFYHALLWCSVTVTGFYYLHASRLTFADMRRLNRNS